MCMWIRWLLAAGLGVGLLAGCAGNEEGPSRTEEAQLPVYPEDQVPDPEPQPADTAPRPPVDTTADRGGQPSPKESYGPAAPQSSRTYVVKQGDTLQKISREFYNTPGRWRDIYQANRDVLKDGPDALKVGMKLKIPG